MKPALALAAIFGCAGCGPRIDVRVAVEKDQVVFHVPHSGVNGLLLFRVQDEAGTPLWQVQLNYEKGERIVYGVLPTGGNAPARQDIPSGTRPPPDIRGKVVKVIVDYQYDSLTPNAGVREIVLRVPD